MYKYFTWVDKDGYRRGQDLLSKDQITRLLPLRKDCTEVFATIQDYDADGNVIGCPLYFDIDSPSLMEAYNDMVNLCADLRDDYDVEPMVWFSGSKGFHVVMPLYVRHKRCHDIVKEIAKGYGSDCIDMAVYRRRSMWRCNGTRNGKSGLFKVNTTSSEMFRSMIDRANWNNQLTLEQPVVVDLDITEHVKLLPKMTMSTGDTKGTQNIEMVPCIAKLWLMDEPPVGQRHYMIGLVARWCYQSGMDQEDVGEMFAGHIFWGKITPNDYLKVIRSVYSNGRASIGCKSGNDADILKPHCMAVCPYSGATPQELMG